MKNIDLTSEVRFYSILKCESCGENLDYTCYDNSIGRDKCPICGSTQIDRKTEKEGE